MGRRVHRLRPGAHPGALRDALHGDREHAARDRKIADPGPRRDGRTRAADRRPERRLGRPVSHSHTETGTARSHDPCRRAGHARARRGRRVRGEPAAPHRGRAHSARNARAAGPVPRAAANDRRGARARGYAPLRERVRRAREGEWRSPARDRPRGHSRSGRRTLAGYNRRERARTPRAQSTFLPSMIARRLAVVAVAALLAAPPARPADLRIGMSADVTSIDPHFVNITPNNTVAWHIFEALTDVDENVQLIPGLAESWRAVDPTTWEFRLRKGVRFSDGSELTAEDVAFSIDRPATLTSSPGPFTTFTRPIVRKEIVDRHTIRVRTATPYAMVPYDLNSVFIVSKKAAAAATTEDFNTGKAAV